MFERNGNFRDPQIRQSWTIRFQHKHRFVRQPWWDMLIWSLTHNFFCWVFIWSFEPVKNIAYQVKMIEKTPHLRTIIASIDFETKSVGGVIPRKVQLQVLIARRAMKCLRFQFWNSQLVLRWTWAVRVTKRAFFVLKFFTIHHGTCKVFRVSFRKSVRLQPFLGQDCKLCIYSCRANDHACDVFRLLASPILD